MPPRIPEPGPLIEWQVATRPARGESLLGDAHLVQPFDGGVLLAVVDGLGHGAEAGAAACAAIEVFKRHPNHSVISLLRQSHEALLRTRGAVMTLATLNSPGDTVTWIGVGNVEGRLLRGDQLDNRSCECAPLRGGVVGYRLPAPHASVVSVSPGDLLIFATDGIHAGFDVDVAPGDPVDLIAERTIDHFYKGYDDALVLAVRYLGAQPVHNGRASIRT